MASHSVGKKKAREHYKAPLWGGGASWGARKNPSDSTVRPPPEKKEKAISSKGGAKKIKKNNPSECLSAAMRITTRSEKIPGRNKINQGEGHTQKKKTHQAASIRAESSKHCCNLSGGSMF